MKYVFIVSHSEDIHAKYLISKLPTNGIKFVLIDISLYPHSIEISFNVDSKSRKKVVVGYEGRDYREDNIVGIWWRRPLGLRKNKKCSLMDTYIEMESLVAVHSLYDFLPCANWISPPNATTLASRKPVQLKLAQKLGFRIPLTCISNSPDQVLSFIKRLGKKRLTMKPLGSSFVRLAKNARDDSRFNKVIFTQAVDPKIIVENLDLVRNCPVIFQEAIEKDTDIRVTVVDNDIFSAEVVTHNEKDPNNLDWRNYAYEHEYHKHNLPKEVQDFCVQITKRLGLRFGCIDLAFSKKSGYTFFEINPQGQWLTFEMKLGYTISGSLVKALTSGVLPVVGRVP